MAIVKATGEEVDAGQYLRHKLGKDAVFTSSFVSRRDRLNYGGLLYSKGEVIPDFGRGDYDHLLLTQGQVLQVSPPGEGVGERITRQAKLLEERRRRELVET